MRTAGDFDESSATRLCWRTLAVLLMQQALYFPSEGIQGYHHPFQGRQVLKSLLWLQCRGLPSLLPVVGMWKVSQASSCS